MLIDEKLWRYRCGDQMDLPLEIPDSDVDPCAESKIMVDAYFRQAMLNKIFPEDKSIIKKVNGV